MVEQTGPQTAVVTRQELGTNCWLAKRFMKGGCCDRVWTCSYPEKKTCKAVLAEIEYKRAYQKRLLILHQNTDTRIAELRNMR